MFVELIVFISYLVLSRAEPPDHLGSSSFRGPYGPPLQMNAGRNPADYERPAAVVSFNLFRSKTHRPRDHSYPEVSPQNIAFGQTRESTSGTQEIYRKAYPRKSYTDPNKESRQGPDRPQYSGIQFMGSQYLDTDRSRYSIDSRLSSEQTGDYNFLSPYNLQMDYDQNKLPPSKSAYGVSTKQDMVMDEPANYDFLYHVMAKDGSEYGHEESREGDGTHGKYHVLLPDGRLQVVHYTADQGGFKPVITFKDTGNNQDVNNPY